MGQWLLELKVAGALSTTATNIAIAVAPFAGVITNLVMTLGKTGNGTLATTFDINKNGTSIFSVNPTFTGTTGIIGYGTLTTDPVVVAAGDIFTLDLDAPGIAYEGAYFGLLLDAHNIGASMGTLSDLKTVI